MWRKKNLLLGMVALCTRMRTSLHTSPTLRIYCPSPHKPFQPLLLLPNLPLNHLNPHMWHIKLAEDHIDMLESSYVQHKRPVILLRCTC